MYEEKRQDENSTRYYAQDRVRKIEAAKKADILRTVKAATKAVVNSATKLAESIKSTSPAVTETAQNEWWKNNSLTYSGPVQRMGGVAGVGIYSYVNSFTYTIIEKILEFRQKHPMLYTLALTTIIGLIATFAGGAIASIALSAMEVACGAVTTALVLTVLKAYMYLLLGDTDKAAELFMGIPETERDAFETGAICGAIAEVLSMLISKVWDKICELFGKGKDSINANSTPAVAESGNLGTNQVLSDTALKHPLNDHMPARFARQVEYRTRASVEKYLSEKTFFNPAWSEEQIIEALNYGYNSALESGIASGNFTFSYLGENATVFLQEGVFHTGYGYYSFSYEEILSFLGGM
ncbi:MAG: hypothetical protein K5679_08285 [Lachnospiraceae bacterium]|nr:hypothetical protein [Lachnospiraceae bacterium]